MTAKDAISSQIAPLRSSMSLTEASVLMREMHRRSLPVVDSDGDYVGMFNEPYESSSDSAMGCVGDFLVEYDAVGGTYPLLMLLESMVSGRRSIVPVVEDGTDVFIGARGGGETVSADSGIDGTYGHMYPRQLQRVGYSPCGGRCRRTFA